MFFARIAAAIVLTTLAIALGGCGKAERTSDSTRTPESMIADNFMKISGCTSATPPSKLAADNRSIPLTFKIIARISADTIAAEDWDGGPQHGLSQTTLRKKVSFSPSGYELGCDKGTMYVQTPGLIVPAEVCEQDMQGVYSTTDGKKWTVEGLHCAGDIGPICTDTPKSMREAWYPKPNAMWASCGWA